MDTGADRLEEDVLLFFGGHMEVYPLYKQLEAELLRRYPGTRVKVTKTQISFSDRYMFACVSFLRPRRKSELPGHYFVLTLGLPGPLMSERVAAKVEAYPGRWTTHIPVSRESDLDGELFDWLDQAHAFAQRK